MLEKSLKMKSEKWKKRRHGGLVKRIVKLLPIMNKQIARTVKAMIEKNTWFGYNLITSVILKKLESNEQNTR